MLRSIAVWVTITAATAAAGADYSAITKADAALRAAPNIEAVQTGVVPAQTALDVTICFHEGDYCHVTGPSIDGYVAGDLLTIDGEQSTVLDAEKARWALMEENRQRDAIPEWEADNIVVWGDSLSDRTFGDELSRLLPGRSVSMQGVPGESGKQIAERMLADTRYNRRFKIIWDRHFTNEKPADYLRDLAPIIDKAKSEGDFLVVSDIRQLLPSDNIPDPSTDAAIAASINQQLAALYPVNFVDVTAALEDLATRGPDGLHLTDLGNQRVAAALAEAIQRRDAVVATARN